MKRTGLMLAVVVALQVGWIAATAIRTETQLQGTTTVLLETAPVDPRDLLRGDYVILNYKISSIPREWITGASQRFIQNEPIYVVLEKRREINQAVAASLNPPANVSTNQVVVRGTASMPYQNSPRIGVTYGIERYYVPEGLGNPRGMLAVRCVVKPDHTLLLQQLLVDGQPFSRETRQR
jgi:uncharacterized membrane-anchored protein